MSDKEMEEINKLIYELSIKLSVSHSEILECLEDCCVIGQEFYGDLRNNWLNN